MIRMDKNSLKPDLNRIRQIEELAEQNGAAARLAGERARDRGAAVQEARRIVRDLEQEIPNTLSSSKRETLHAQLAVAKLALARAEEERAFAAARYSAAAELAQVAFATRDAVRKYCRSHDITMPEPIMQLAADARTADARVFG